jgi:AcrR family transcriptional regulator
MRRRDKADKQARISVAARALFEERGYDGTTVRAIAERAGVATGTVLLYGDSKAELLFRLFVDELEDVMAEREASLEPAAPLPERVLHLLTGFLERYAARPALARVYVKETMFQPASEQSERYAEVTARFLGRLTETIATGPIRPGMAPTTAAAAVFGVYLLHVVELLRTPGAPPLALVQGSLEAMVRDILGP